MASFSVTSCYAYFYIEGKAVALDSISTILNTTADPSDENRRNSRYKGVTAPIWVNLQCTLREPKLVLV
jgi:hypothetical protein